LLCKQISHFHGNTVSIWIKRSIISSFDCCRGNFLAILTASPYKIKASFIIRSINKYNKKILCKYLNYCSFSSDRVYLIWLQKYHVSEWLLFNTNWAIFQIYKGDNTYLWKQPVKYEDMRTALFGFWNKTTLYQVNFDLIDNMLT
jgi:hypothetical protein